MGDDRAKEVALRPESHFFRSPRTDFVLIRLLRAISRRRLRMISCWTMQMIPKNRTSGSDAKQTTSEIMECSLWSAWRTPCWTRDRLLRAPILKVSPRVISAACRIYLDDIWTTMLSAAQLPTPSLKRCSARARRRRARNWHRCIDKITAGHPQYCGLFF